MEGYLPINEIADVFELGQDIVEKVGDCSNMERKVNSNSAFWKNVVRRGGWILQKDCFSDKARIVDDNGIQKGNGSMSAMQEKMERLLSDDFLRAGDIIGVSRGAYEHYAVYAGDRRVIHYAGDSSDFKERVSIRETPFEEFQKDSSEYFVLSFEGRYPVKIHSSTKFISGGYFDCCNIKWRGKYSPEETLKRAYSRIGETRYSVINNNCEHFALWCKTGNAQSTQVKLIARYLIAAGVGLSNIAESRDDIIRYLAWNKRNIWHTEKRRIIMPGYSGGRLSAGESGKLPVFVCGIDRECPCRMLKSIYQRTHIL